jgi:ABC-2 type transport system ATP-binding protein
MPDFNHLHKWMRICDAIQYYGDMFPDFDFTRAAELSAFLNLEKREKIHNLSSGYRQRLLVMLAFARKARLYLLDEPISNIDPLDRDKVLKTILGGLNEESSIIISTHLAKDIETIVDDLFFLNKGRIILAETAENIRMERGQSIEDCYLEVFANA